MDIEAQQLISLQLNRRGDRNIQQTKDVLNAFLSPSGQMSPNYPMKIIWKKGFIRLFFAMGIVWMLLILTVLLFHVWSCQSSISFFSGCAIPVLDDPDAVTIPKVELRIKLLKISVPFSGENSEPVQIMHYVHEDTRERLDYYGNKARLGFDESLMATVVLYLSNVSHGGETLFRKSEEDTWSECARTSYAIKPLKGNALLFFNVQPNTAPDENSSNARCPILQGEKWCATKCFYLRDFDRMKISLKSDSDECTDEEDSCPEWAAQRECNRNPMGSQADSGHQQQHNSQFLPLSCQTSFYSLTLDEFQVECY
ncbi:hypothetical protein IFM89_001479 [Coptis chinensis]|uniref:Prolyl 4-hydroxylase alpha subunit domain-containing protein n=1 Tax=Coptis chinensis TaxID=261450 RepID=A0A835LD40_9MAGN|nr:hypothetical protein IFM89_001479 [Coptis chinensis]